MSDTYTEFPGLKYNPQEIAQRGYGVATSGPTDDRLIVGFYRKSVLNQAKSREQGKRIYEDKDWVKIQHPGETLHILDRAVIESDKFRWPRQWAQYEGGKEQVPDGVPLSVLYPANPSITDTLIGYNIHTVEQLSNLSGNAIQTVGMGCQEWVNYAKKYLEQANKGVDFHRFEKAISEKDQQISTLGRQVRELSTQLARIMRREEPQNVDAQSAQINARVQQRFDPEPAVTFANEIQTPDLSGEVKRRGRPKGSRNKPKEI